MSNGTLIIPEKRNSSLNFKRNKWYISHNIVEGMLLLRYTLIHNFVIWIGALIRNFKAISHIISETVSVPSKLSIKTLSTTPREAFAKYLKVGGGVSPFSTIHLRSISFFSAIAYHMVILLNVSYYYI